MTMIESGWPKDELRRIAETDDLQIAPFRPDGATYGTPTWIWSVVVGDDLGPIIGKRAHSATVCVVPRATET